MGQTLTRYLLSSAGNLDTSPGQQITDSSGNQLVLAANEFPVKITASGTIGRIAAIQGPGIIKVCSNNTSNSYAISPSFTIKADSDNGTTITHTSPAWLTFSGGNLKGQPLALIATNGAYRHSQWEIKIYTKYAISAPGTITAPTSASDIFILSWVASTANDGVIDHYEIQVRDRTNSNASWSNWFTLNISTTTEIVVSPNTSANQAQRQYRIRAIGTDTSYNSEWNTSNTVTYLSGLPQTVVQYEVITAATGKTYEI